MMRKKMNALWMKPVLVCAVLCVCLLPVRGICYGDHIDEMIDQATVQIQRGDARYQIEKLAKTKDPRAVEFLLAVVKDHQSYERSHAARALGMTGDRSVFEPLIDRMKNDSDAYVRAGAIDGLGLLGDTRAVEPLVALVEKEVKKPTVYFALNMPYDSAIKALGRLKDPRATEVLTKALYKEHYGARQDIAYALGSIGDERAVEPLIAVLKGKHKPSVFLKAKIKVMGLFLNIWRGMGGTIGERDGVAYALGKIGDPRAIEPLIKATRDRDKTVRGEAIDALGNFNDPRVIKTLEKIAQNEMGISGYSAEKALENIANIQNS
jgi:HEAT repeat protein